MCVSVCVHERVCACVCGGGGAGKGVGVATPVRVRVGRGKGGGIHFRPLNPGPGPRLVLGDLSRRDARDALLDAPPQVGLPQVVQAHAPFGGWGEESEGVRCWACGARVRRACPRVRTGQRRGLHSGQRTWASAPGPPPTPAPVRADEALPQGRGPESHRGVLGGVAPGHGRISGAEVSAVLRAEGLWDQATRSTTP